MFKRFSVLGNSEKIPFGYYLRMMMGREMAEEILSMTPLEKKNTVIIIDGKHVPTGKTTLCYILKKHGYKALELYEHIYIRLDEKIQRPVPNFNMFVE